MSVERSGTAGRLGRAKRRAARWWWVVVGVGIAAAKAQAFEELAHHRMILVAGLAAALLEAIVRLRLVEVAILTGPLLAFVLAPGWISGFALAVGTFALLLTVFLAIATVLRARQRRAGAWVPASKPRRQLRLRAGD